MTDRNDIVVVGASLGGLEALCRIVEDLPEDFPAAVLIVLHTGTGSPRLLADILGRHAALPVSYGRQGEEIRSGHVYFASPGHHLIVTAPGFINLVVGPKVKHARPAADRLFQSAASVYGRRVIGVVLSGGDGDGTEGLKAINAAGGRAIVQDPKTATAPSMPMTALHNDHPDAVVPLDEIGRTLCRMLASGS